MFFFCMRVMIKIQRTNVSLKAYKRVRMNTSTHTHAKEEKVIAFRNNFGFVCVNERSVCKNIHFTCKNSCDVRVKKREKKRSYTIQRIHPSLLLLFLNYIFKIVSLFSSFYLFRSPHCRRCRRRFQCLSFYFRVSAATLLCVRLCVCVYLSLSQSLCMCVCVCEYW